MTADVSGLKYCETAALLASPEAQVIYDVD